MTQWRLAQGLLDPGLTRDDEIALCPLSIAVMLVAGLAGEVAPAPNRRIGRIISSGASTG